jgi:hypothetical protein
VKERALEILDEEIGELRKKLTELPVDNTQPNQELYFITRELGVIQKVRQRLEAEL